MSKRRYKLSVKCPDCEGYGGDQMIRVIDRRKNEDGEMKEYDHYQEDVELDIEACEPKFPNEPFNVSDADSSGLPFWCKNHNYFDAPFEAICIEVEEEAWSSHKKGKHE